MAKSLDDQVKDLADELAQVKRVNVMKDRQIGSQQRNIAELQRKLSALAQQVSSLSTSLSRLR